MKHGKGVFETKDGDSYDGEWQNDMKHGKGVLTTKDGEVYEEEWNQGEKLVNYNE